MYRANRNNNGAAMQLDFNPEKEAVFLECAQQVGEQRFDWQNKITVKLSLADVGKFLAVLAGRSGEAKLYHDPGKGDYGEQSVRNRVVELRRNERAGGSAGSGGASAGAGSGAGFGFGLKVSQQGKDGRLQAISITIGEDEAVVMETLLRQAIVGMHGW